MNLNGLAGLGLRPGAPAGTGASAPLSSRIDIPTPQLGTPPGWMGGIRRALGQWGEGWARQVMNRSPRAGGAANASAATGARAGASRGPASAVAGGSTSDAQASRPSMAALTASVQQTRQAQFTEALACIRMLADLGTDNRPLALPAPPAHPGRSLPPSTPMPMPMATLSRATYMECLGALASAPGPLALRPGAGSSARPAVSPGAAGRLALLDRPSGGVGGADTQTRNRQPIPASARASARPARDLPTPLGIGPGLGRRPPEPVHTATAGLSVSTPDLIEEPDDPPPPPARPPITSAATVPSAAAGQADAALKPAAEDSAPPPAEPESSALVHHAQHPGPLDRPAAAPAAAALPSPPQTSGASEPDAKPASKPADAEHEALIAEARELKLQALRDSIEQLRNKAAEARFQRIAKSIEFYCSIT